MVIKNLWDGVKGSKGFKGDGDQEANQLKALKASKDPIRVLSDSSRNNSKLDTHKTLKPLKPGKGKKKTKGDAIKELDDGV